MPTLNDVILGRGFTLIILTGKETCYTIHPVNYHTLKKHEKIGGFPALKMLNALYDVYNLL